VEFSDKRATVKALAFRGQTDAPAGVGHSYKKSVPGSTPYTKGSELENAETSALMAAHSSWRASRRRTWRALRRSHLRRHPVRRL
jgi:hypothetical protein